MRLYTPVRIVAALALSGLAAPAGGAQSGDGFLFRPPPGALTVFGGFAAPFASGGVFGLATDALTVDRGDFRSGSYGADLSITLRPRLDLVVGFERSSSRSPSEYRDWVDNNDQPIEQVTRFRRMPITASARYYLKDRGRRIGSVAWVPARFVPYVSAGAGMMQYQFTQRGDFVDEQTLNIFSADLVSKGWAPVLQAGGGAHWNLNPRFHLTGELRYLHATGRGDEPSGDFAGYRVNLSGVSSLVGISLRF